MIVLQLVGISRSVRAAGDWNEKYRELVRFLKRQNGRARQTSAAGSPIGAGELSNKSEKYRRDRLLRKAIPHGSGRGLQDVEDLFGALERRNQVCAGQFAACPDEHFPGYREAAVAG